MKKIFNHLQLGLLGMIAIFAASCQHEKLSEVVTVHSYANVNASLAARTDVATGSTYTLTGADLTVPATISFSSVTTSAFSVNLTSNVDTVASLITSGVLPAGTVAFQSGAAAVLPQINVPAGVTSVSFNIIVSRSAIELSYGKTLAAVIKLASITKSNKIASGKNAMIFTVKTADILAANSIHEVGFGIPSSQFIVSQNPSSLASSSSSITVNIPVTLQGDAGAEFTVDAVSVPDSVTKYINNGTLTNNVLYTDDNISLSTPKVKILAGTNTAYLTFTTKTTTLLAFQPSPGAPTIKLPTIAFNLTNPSKYKITKKINTVYVTLDPNYFRPYYGVPFLVKGTIGAVSDEFYAAYYDFGGEGIAYHDDNSKNGDGGWRFPDMVDVSSDYNPRSVVGWTGNDRWLTYSINVEQTGTYQMNAMLGSPGNGNTYSVYIDNVLKNSQLPVINSSDYRNQKPNLSTINLTAGYHILKMYWNRAQYDFQGVIFTRLN